MRAAAAVAHKYRLDKNAPTVIATPLNGLEKRLRDWQGRARLALAGWTFRALPRLSGSALEVAASAFKRAPAPAFFSPDLRPLAPTLNDDLLELYGRALQVCGNQFAFLNSPQAFAQGIDWEPAQSPAWRAELHAFDYALDLACTFRISGETVYARQLRYAIAHWIAGNPPAAGTGWQPHVLARRVRNWMLAADLARRDWQQDAEFSGVAMESLALQLSFLLAHLDSLPSPGARLDASRALLCASRFFAGGKAREAREVGLELLAGELAFSHPQPWPINRLAKAQALMEWNLWSEPHLHPAFLAAELREALDQLEAVLTPDGCLSLIGPQARLAADELADLAALAAVKLASPAWKSLAGKFGILPYLCLGEPGRERFEALDESVWTPHDHVQADAEIVRLAGPRKSALMVSARLPAGPGEHQDFMSYELALNGWRVVVDSGGFSPQAGEYFAQARAHNSLTVDGHEPRWQNRRRSAKEACEYSPACARLRMSHDGFAFLGVQHDRAWFRLADDAWLVLDRLTGSGVHGCASRIHFYSTYEIVTEGDRFLARSHARSFAVIPVSREKPASLVARGDHPQFPGWYSPDYGVKYPAAVLALEWTAIELPWMGGVLVAGDAKGQLRSPAIDPVQGVVQLEFSGKAHDLRME